MLINYSNKMYRLARDVLGIGMNCVYRPEILGIENLPSHGPYILAGNHKSLLDIELVAIATKQDIRFIAKEELFQKALPRFLLTKMGAIPIRRNQVDLSAIKKALEILKQEQVLGIFPEGTRHKGPGIGTFKSGAAMLSVKSKAPIIPFGISGEYKIGTHIRIQFGDAISFSRFQLKEGLADRTLEDAVKKLILE